MHIIQKNILWTFRTLLETFVNLTKKQLRSFCFALSILVSFIFGISIEIKFNVKDKSDS